MFGKKKNNVESPVDELQASLQPEADNASKVDDLEKEIQEKDVQIRLLNETILKHEETIGLLNEELIKKPKAKNEPVTFELDGKTYQVIAGTSIPGIEAGKGLTALDISMNEEAQKWLIDRQSGLVRELK